LALGRLDAVGGVHDLARYKTAILSHETSLGPHTSVWVWKANHPELYTKKALAAYAHMGISYSEDVDDEDTPRMSYS
jgi:hypothetical protein